MKCGTLTVLEACGEAVGRTERRHLDACEPCAAEAGDFREIRRLYAASRPVRLHARTKRAIVARIRRERNRGRIRSAIAGLAGLAAAAILMTGIGGAPISMSAAEPAVAAGSTVDRVILELNERIAEVEAGDRSLLDAALDDLKHRVGSLSWDAESM